MPRPPLLERSLAVVNPQVAAQLHPTRNDPLDPRAVSAGSRIRLWWQCPAGHDWQAKVTDRTRGTGCPSCAGHRATPDTSIAAHYPVLMAEWAADLNGDLDPATVLPGSSRRVWWRCTRDPSHLWEVKVKDRACRATGCPFCTGRRVTLERSLAALHPEVAADWDPTRNDNRTPDAVAAGSPALAWWRCPAGHSWEAQIASRTTGGCGCPYCAGRRATPATSLAVTHPALAQQWDRTRNGDLTPAAVRPGSNIAVWWQCPAGHCWQAPIVRRSRVNSGCPTCAPRANHGHQLATTRPDLAAQWSRPLNGGGPGTITTGSHVKAWWVCPADPTHLWRTAVGNRVRGQTGCPYCAHKRPTPATCLAAVAPHLIDAWHPEHNGALSPTDVLPYSATPVWWQCPDGHEWTASPAHRLTSTGCPDCAARTRPPVHH